MSAKPFLAEIEQRVKNINDAIRFDALHGRTVSLVIDEFPGAALAQIRIAPPIWNEAVHEHLLWINELIRAIRHDLIFSIEDGYLRFTERQIPLTTYRHWL